MKKFLSLLLVMALCLSLSAGAFASGEPADDGADTLPTLSLTEVVSALVGDVSAAAAAAKTALTQAIEAVNAGTVSVDTVVDVLTAALSDNEQIAAVRTAVENAVAAVGDDEALSAAVNNVVETVKAALTEAAGSADALKELVANITPETVEQYLKDLVGELPLPSDTPTADEISEVVSALVGDVSTAAAAAKTALTQAIEAVNAGTVSVDTVVDALTAALSDNEQIAAVRTAVENAVAAVGDDEALSAAVNNVVETVKAALTEAAGSADTLKELVANITPETVEQYLKDLVGELPTTVPEAAEKLAALAESLTGKTVPQMITAIREALPDQIGSVTLPKTGTCGDRAFYIDFGKLLVIAGSGAVDAGSESGWASDAGSIKNIIVANNITALPDGIFSNLTAAEYIVLADSVTEIGDILADDSSAMILCSVGSAAETWAKDNNKSYFSFEVHVDAGGDKDDAAVGDLNGDGTVNVVDALRLFRAVNGQIDLADSTQGDVNGDGFVNIIDALRLFRAVNGQIKL